jgi:peptide/nickel transport system ATP-binding protein
MIEKNDRTLATMRGAGDDGVILDVQHLVKHFQVRRSFAESMRREKGSIVHAVDDVSFQVRKGEIMGLVGESGSGKTTVLRSVLMLTQPSSGAVLFKGVDLAKVGKRELKKYRPKLQMVFQDPYESINPRMTIFDVVAEGLFVNDLVDSRVEAEQRVLKALEDVQIHPAEEYVDRYPHELSGGQRQRVAVARAAVMDPEVILADEPVSMLDVSIRAEVLNVLLAIKDKMGVSILMVTHDLALAKDVVDNLSVMYLGKIVERGPAGELVADPYHPYTQALIAAVPVPDPEGAQMKVLASGEIPTNISPPSGCRFHTRCPYAQRVCKEDEPPLSEVAPGRLVACHFWQLARESFQQESARH